MQEPIGVTQIIPPTADAMPVRNDPASDNDAFVVDTPYLLSDGKSREAPIPVVVVETDSWVDRAGNLRDVARFNISGLIPTLTVTGGIITPFNSGGVDYIEVLWQSSGSFTLSAQVATHNRALGAGGATGGRTNDVNFYSSAGGAGGLIEVLGTPLLAGAYTVTIGAGGAAVTTGFGRNNGSNSVLTRPGGTDTAIGGGAGASSGASNTDGNNGGSGGGARGMSSAGAGVIGLGTPGQGFDGGSGFGSTDPALRASGGSGGANGAGGNASSGVAGLAGVGRLLSWIASPITVCSGDRGIVQADINTSSPDRTFGSGSRGVSGTGTVGKGGDGFMFLRVRAADVNVVMA